MSRGLFAPWKSCGVLTMAFWIPRLEDSWSFICPYDLAWVSLSCFVSKGCIILLCTKVKIILVSPKAILLCTQVSLCYVCTSTKDNVIKRKE